MVKMAIDSVGPELLNIWTAAPAKEGLMHLCDASLSSLVSPHIIMDPIQSIC